MDTKAYCKSLLDTARSTKNYSDRRVVSIRSAIDGVYPKMASTGEPLSDEDIKMILVTSALGCLVDIPPKIAAEIALEMIRFTVGELLRERAEHRRLQARLQQLETTLGAEVMDAAHAS